MTGVLTLIHLTIKQQLYLLPTLFCSLSDGPKHGYAITTDVAERTGIQLGPGTLYGSLAKLEKLGLIVPLPSEDRRRPYEITAAGRAALGTQLQRWSRIVETGRSRLAWT